MRALRYFFSEAASSLWRRRRAALLAVLTIASGLFVLGFFLVLNSNLQRLVGRWSESAELSVYLRDDANAEQLRSIDEFVSRSGLGAEREYVSKERAAVRFKEDFPDLAVTSEKLDRNPFPASFEVRLKPEMRDADTAIASLATNLGAMPGVADVRYDRRWLSRLNGAVRLVRGIGLLIIVMLAVASALTVANVVRLAATARSDEIEIMQLVGAPHTYVRGPFVVEGVLQGGVGALAAILLLWGLFAVARARYGAIAADVMGIGDLTFLPAQLWLGLIAGGMLLGCAGGFIVARNVR
jgi:cell division transport system permease protein